MEQRNNLRMLPQLLLPWYEENKRDLPWRKDHEPYHIWLSEIMLQQTRVEAVKGYYDRFLSAVPTINDLAQADDELLHKLWEGLGYYSRVRNLKRAAQDICSIHGGKFPEDFDSILNLPGIGLYTAGAISSIAFNKPIPAVDGNVLRVYTRITENATPIDDPAFKKLVHNRLSCIYPEQASEFTQALMELGATVCVPNGKPDCTGCPCSGICKAYKSGKQLSFPVKEPRKKRKVEDKTVFIMCCDGYYALEKRASSGLLADLWQFPNIPGKFSVEDALVHLEQKGIHVREVLRCLERKHIFTHVEWRMRGIYLEVTGRDDSFKWFDSENIQNSTAIPTAFRQFWDAIGNV